MGARADGFWRRQGHDGRIAAPRTGARGRAVRARLRPNGAFGTGRSFDTSPLKGCCGVTFGYRARTSLAAAAYT